ncbi:MAG: poly(R)-hydroxyalkanoic acid synthase subunit PhaE [Halopseudomonas sp.]
MKPNQLDALHQWLETQTAHWQSLLTDHESDSGDWQTLLDSCQSLAPKQSADQAELTESMVRQAKGFSLYGERLLRSLKNPGQPADLEQAVKDLSTHLHLQAGESFYRHWQIPEPLQQLLHQFGLSPSSFSSFPFLHSSVNRSRDKHQQQLQQLQRSLDEFRQAITLYIELQNQVSQRASDAMTEQLRQQVPAPESLSELQQIWVDCYERCYQQQLETSQYQQAYGSLGNTILTLQQQSRDYWKQEFRALGLVPNSDYLQLMQHHHKLRKSHKQSQRHINRLEQTLEHQQQQLTAFEQQLKQLQSDSASHPELDHG